MTVLLQVPVALAVLKNPKCGHYWSPLSPATVPPLAAAVNAPTTRELEPNVTLQLQGTGDVTTKKEGVDFGVN